MTTGKCKHGSFPLNEGCILCVEERLAGEVKAKLEVEPQLRELEEGLNSEGLTLVPETAIALRLGEDIEVMSYHEQAVKLLKYAEARIIATVDDNKLAVDDLSIISRLKKSMEAKRKEYLDPLKTQVDAINMTYKDLMEPVFSADKITRDKMLAFELKQRLIREAQEEVNRLRMEATKKDAALHNGELSESVNLIEVTPEVKTTRTDMGSSSMTDHWTYEVIDLLLVPREYLVIDNAQLTAIARSHHDRKQIPGIRFVNKPIISVRAKYFKEEK